MKPQTDHPDELKVFISSRDSTCDECGEELGTGAWITLAGEKGALCLACGDLDHLQFLPSGDAALTRRAKKYSKLSAVVLKWSRARKRYERQGLLVEAAGLETAERECLSDAQVRERRNFRAATLRDEFDRQYVEQFAARVRALFPHCPAGREQEIAEHACRKYSGRVGRSASAKAFDENAITLGVVAHIRHRETSYDELLSTGHDRISARREIADAVDEVLRSWRG